jgi:hypothetical protein
MPWQSTRGTTRVARVRRLLGRDRVDRNDRDDRIVGPAAGSLRMRGRAALSALGALACLAMATATAAPGPLVTVVEGPATVLDGRRLLTAAAGLPVAAQAIVETGPDSRLLRIEWPDGQALNLGPDTRVMVAPAGFAARGQAGPAIYLLQGWAKLASPPKSVAPGVITPQVQVQPFEGIVVARVVGDRTWVFVQAGTAGALDRHTRGAEPVALRAGALVERAGRADGVLHERATSAQLREVPRAFRDTLPARYAAAAALKPEPAELPAPSYAMLQPWMTAERAVRSGFIPRFARLLRDRDFRRGVDAHLDRHPEWRPILYPPPPPPPPSAPAARPAAR